MASNHSGSVKDFHQQNPPHDYCSISMSSPPPNLPRVTPPSTSGRYRMPLAAIPFFENLNTPSPPRRAEHLVNRKTRFEREMDNLLEEKENQKGKRSPSKKPSAMEGAEADDKYVGPWVLGKMVGKGASGRVRLARSRWSRVYAAIKIVPSANFNDASGRGVFSKERKALEREVSIMKLLNHPNLMKLYDVYERQGHFYIALEFIAQGELFDYINAKRYLETNEASFFYQQLINGLQYLHSFGICHRDLKPENLLLDDDLTLKIADFGMASFQAEDEWLRTSCGSPHYASPEIISGSYYHGAMVDVWSSGVILYALLVGRLPFDDPHIPTVMKLASRAEYYLPPEMPRDAADLIEQIFVINQNMRITIPHIVSHPFLRRVWVPDRSLPARRVPVGPPPFNPYSTILPSWTLTLGNFDPELLQGVGAIMRNDNLQDVMYRIHSSSDVWAKRFYHLLKARKDQLETEQKRLDELRAGSFDQGSVVVRSASPVGASIRYNPPSDASASNEKENTPPEPQNSGKKQRNRVLHAFSGKRRKSERTETSVDLSLDDHSSIDDVFRSGPDEEDRASGRTGLVSGLFRVASPSSRVAATQSWKERISNAISRTGLRLKTSKRKKSPEEHFDVASDAPTVPPLPEFLKNMVSSCPTEAESGDIAPRSISPIRERLSQFFSRDSSDSPPSPVAARATTREGDLLVRPPLHERVSTIADRKITHAVPRDQLDDVVSHPYGMSSHLSLHEPEFPILIQSPLRATAGAAEKVTRPMFETEVSKSESRAVDADFPTGELTREMLWEGDVVDCYGRCVDFMRLYGIEIWMLDRQTPGLHCRLESPGPSNLEIPPLTIHFRVRLIAFEDLPDSVTWRVTRIVITLEDGPMDQFDLLVANLRATSSPARIR
ncbi:hypothetical protein NliqN6_5089 [Naganishia liquefaciens]|uniref:Protein kinase domain-containing protein n=1 Tax=Naganishia liquefaciens TaxID=104408 RepID=A0A8H3TX05_9TREE|nr:hypothetical protein NliqN6_5089 [Naganishia liquefaciens]